jgi:hypothetical protein
MLAPAMISRAKWFDISFLLCYYIDMECETTNPTQLKMEEEV